MRPTRSATSRTCLAVLTCAALVVAAEVPGRAQDEDFVPVTDAMLQDPDPADWLMWRRTLDGWGYSPLDSITPENVGDLRMVWSRALMPGTQEGTPLAYRGVLYRGRAEGRHGDSRQDRGGLYPRPGDGRVLWATPTVTQNVISDIDGATGTVTENAEVVFTGIGQEVLACPTWLGGKDWEAGAYSPLTNTMYFPLRNACARMMATPPREDDLGARLYSLAVRNQLAPGIDQLGTVRAISVETGETVWQHDQRAMTMSLVATGGGLVFGGDANGRFRAFDHETGEVLWEINLGSPVTGFPITYAVDGRQYVAVSTGVAGTSGGLLVLTPELRPSLGNNLFVFALPE